MSNFSQQPMFCYNHPRRETLLRCNKCERPICTACGVRTPTGYRCKECVSGQQKIFDTAQWWDFPLAILTAAVLAYFSTYIARVAGFFMFLLAPIAGIIIAEAVRRVLKKRRSRNLPIITAGAALFGAVIPTIFSLVLVFLYSGQTIMQNFLPALLSLIWPVLFALLVSGTVYYRLKGIRV